MDGSVMNFFCFSGVLKTTSATTSTDKPKTCKEKQKGESLVQVYMNMTKIGLLCRFPEVSQEVFEVPLGKLELLQA